MASYKQKADKSKTHVKLGKKKTEPVSHVMLLQAGRSQLSTVTNLLSRGREKVCINSTLRPFYNPI